MLPGALTSDGAAAVPARYAVERDVNGTLADAGAGGPSSSISPSSRSSSVTTTGVALAPDCAASGRVRFRFLVSSALARSASMSILSGVVESRGGWLGGW